VADLPDMSVDTRVAGDTANPGAGGTREAAAKGDDKLRYKLEYGFGLRTGPYLHGTIATSLANVPVSGSFQAGLDALVGGGQETGASFSAMGLPLMEGAQKEKQLLSLEQRRVILATWGMGGLFAEGGADLRFLLGVDPVVADLSGRFTGISLSSLLPTGGDFTAVVSGGVRGQLIGTPTLGLGLWFGTPGLFSARGGVKVPISATMTAVPTGTLKLRYADGAFGGGAKLALPLYFGINTMVEPYLKLAGLDGLIPEFAIPTKAAGPFTLLKTRKVLDLPIELGDIGGPPGKADVILAREELPLEEEAPAPNVETTKASPQPVSSEPTEASTEKPGSGEVLEDTSMISTLTSQFADEPWFQRGQKVLDFLGTIGEWLAGGAEKIGQVLDWIAGYIDIPKFADAIVKAIETTTPPDGKVGLVALLGRIAGNLVEGSQSPSSSTEEEYVLPFGAAQVSLKASGEEAIVSRNALRANVDFGTDPQGGFTWGEGGPKGTLVGSISLGGSDAYGVIEGARFEVDATGVATRFTGNLVPGTALAAFGMTGEVSGSFLTQGMLISSLRLEQPSEALALPCSVGGVELKAEPQRVSFAQRTEGTWSLVLGDANTVAVPFGDGEGRFVAQLRSYEMKGDQLSASGMLFAEVGWLGRAVADLEIENNKLKNLSLGLETERFGYPPALSGRASGKLEVKDGVFDGAELRVALSTNMDGKETDIGDAAIVAKQGPSGIETDLEAKADPSALSKIKLFGVLTPRALEFTKKAAKPLVARGAMGMDIPSFGSLDGELRYDGAKGFEGRLDGRIDRPEVSGDLRGSYDASGLAFSGNGSFAIPGFERFDAGLSYAGTRIAIGIDAKTDLIKTKIGTVDLHGGIDALSYDFATGRFGGAAHVEGEVPILGKVRGAITLAEDRLAIEKGVLQFSNKTLAIPEDKPAVKGSLVTEGEGLIYTAKEGLSGTVLGSGIETDLPGLGKKLVDFRLSFAESKPSGYLRVARNEDKGDGYFWLKSLDGTLDPESGLDIGASVGANLMGTSADLEGRLGPEGFSIAATNITIGTPKDVIYGEGISVGYSSASGISFAGEARARINDRLQGAIGLSYQADKEEGKGKRLDATMSVDATLMEKQAATPITLADFGFGAPLFAFFPIPITLYGKLGARAQLTYGMDKALTLRGQAQLSGVDLSKATFEEATLAPELQGNLFGELSGGPYIGLGAALLLDWAANITGKIHFKVGARADLDPKLSGVLRYKPGEGVTAGGKVRLPLIMKLVAKPTAELTASILGGLKTFDFGSMQLAEFDLMKPKTLLDLELDFGSMKGETKAPGDNPSALPDAPEPGDTCKQDPKDVAGSPETAPTLPQGKSPEGSIDSAPGPFSFGAMLAPLKEKALAKAAELKGYWDSVSALTQALFQRALAIGAGPYTTVRDTLRWAALFFGGDLSRAREGTESAKTILGIPHIQGYSPALRDAIKNMSKEQAAKLHGVMTEEEQARSQTNVIAMGGLPPLFAGVVFSGPAAPIVMVGGGIAWFAGTVMSGERTRRAKELREGLEASIGLEGALQRDVDRMEKGDRAALRLLFVQFVTVMRDRSLGPVLRALTPPGESELSAFDYREQTGVSLVGELKNTENTTIAEFYKSAEVKELQLVQRYFVEVEGLARGETVSLFEAITNTYSVLGSGYEVRRRMEAAGILNSLKLVEQAFVDGTDGSAMVTLRPAVLALRAKNELDERAWKALATGDPFAFASWIEGNSALFSLRRSELGPQMAKLRRIHEFFRELYGDDERAIHVKLATIIEKFYPGTSYFYVSSLHGPKRSEVEEALIVAGIFKSESQHLEEMANREELPSLEVEPEDRDREDELRLAMIEAMPELSDILPQKLNVGPFSTLDWLTGESNKSLWTRLWNGDEARTCARLAAVERYAAEVHTYKLPHVPHLPDETRVSRSRVDAIVNRVKGYIYAVYGKLELETRERRQTQHGSSYVTVYPRQEAYKRVASVFERHGVGHPTDNAYDKRMIAEAVPERD
jgi:hypothetical protein